jgi:hypothetical protein
MVSESVDSKIGYYVTVGTQIVDFSASDSATNFSDSFTITPNEDTATKGSIAMTAAINIDDFNSAAVADDYLGTVTFYYSAT